MTDGDVLYSIIYPIGAVVTFIGVVSWIALVYDTKFDEEDLMLSLFVSFLWPLAVGVAALFGTGFLLIKLCRSYMGFLRESKKKVKAAREMRMTGSKAGGPAYTWNRATGNFEPVSAEIQKEIDALLDPTTPYKELEKR